MSRFLGRFVLPVAVVAAVVAIALPASADPRTITVLMPDGALVTVEVDVPPGTPLASIALPEGGMPVSDSWGEIGAPPADPAVEVPSPVQQQPDPERQRQDQEQQQAQQQQQSQQEAEEREADEKKAEERRAKRKRRQREKESADEEEAADDEDSPTHRRRLDPGRNPDGTPNTNNPSYFDALPGPSQVKGVPNFVIRKFRVPIFLLPIYQAAGIQYGVRWEILAAINEIETDYGRNLNVSSAGALGWMQFMPATWRTYGVDANKDGEKDPYNPVDAIFAAARYLKAAGYGKDIKRSIFAYNHADWYVDSVLLRARLIAGVPGDLVGSLTGLTEGRFPVYARARYADDLSEKEAEKRFRRGQNAARVEDGDDSRRSIAIYSRKGAPVVAVNDGVIKKIGSDERHGNYIVLQDVYGNRYMYAGLGKVSRYYPVPRTDLDAKRQARAIKAGKDDPAPTAAASAGRSEDEPQAPALRPVSDLRPQVAVKDRMFANPSRPAARDEGGLEQLLDAKARKNGYELFNNYFSRPLGLKAKDMRIRKLKRGSRVIGGTILGRVGRPVEGRAAHVVFEIRPAGRGAPLIDPKPILDGWKLLEATAIYRASGRNALYAADGKDTFSIGQILLLPKHLLERRVLSDERIEIYDCGRKDIRSGQIDRRVLASLAYLAESGLRPTVTSLRCGHSVYTSSGNISQHSSGNAVDIARINGIPILGHQEEGGVTEQTVKRLLRLQGTLQPDQVISLLDFGGPTLAMGDHDDHVHLGFRPLFGSNKRLGAQASAILKPGQWTDLIERLREIDNPVVRTKPSEHSLHVRKRRASHAHRGE